MANKKKERVYLKNEKMIEVCRNFVKETHEHWYNIINGVMHIHPKVEGEDMEQVTLEMFNELSGKVNTLSDNINSFVKEQQRFNDEQRKFNDEQREFNNTQKQFNKQVFEFMQRQDKNYKTVIKRLDNLDNRLDNIVAKNNLIE